MMISEEGEGWGSNRYDVKRRRRGGGYEAGRMQAGEEGGERAGGQVAARAKWLLGRGQARGHACRPGQQQAGRQGMSPLTVPSHSSSYIIM